MIWKTICLSSVTIFIPAIMMLAQALALKQGPANCLALLLLRVPPIPVNHLDGMAGIGLAVRLGGACLHTGV